MCIELRCSTTTTTKGNHAIDCQYTNPLKDVAGQHTPRKINRRIKKDSGRLKKYSRECFWEWNDNNKNKGMERKSLIDNQQKPEHQQFDI